MADIRFKLNTGVEIPALGLGTWQSDVGEVKKAVSYALAIGYKHVDCGNIHLQSIRKKTKKDQHIVTPMRTRSEMVSRKLLKVGLREKMYLSPRSCGVHTLHESRRTLTRV